ncbi:MAG TPA: hypothetical protein VGJ26_13685 [Pirellulales bacterium]
MARQEHEKEDLLAEATALVERIEIALAVSDAEQRIVIGFRRDGAASLYFGEEPAWHFNTAGELRRAYAHGRLYKAERGGLIALDRRRTEKETQLVRHELNTEENAALTGELRQCASELAAIIDAGRYQIIGQVPSDADMLTRVRPLLAALAKEVTIAAGPRVQ